jgi:hypothetical protein
MIRRFALHSDNWLTFGSWEFELCRRAGYLGDVDFFNREVGVGLADEENQDEGHNDEEDVGQGDALFVDDVAPDEAVNTEI